MNASARPGVSSAAATNESAKCERRFLAALTERDARQLKDALAAVITK